MSNDNQFAIAEVTPGKLNALVKNIMTQTGTTDPNEAVRLVNSGEVTLRWKSYTRLISGGRRVIIPALGGTKTIASAEDVFPNHIDAGFNRLNVPGKATGETEVAVHEQVVEGKYREIFGGFNRPLGDLCLSQHQIVWFFATEAENFLQEDGWAAVFLFLFKERNMETGEDEFFVAICGRGAGGSRNACLSPFEVSRYLGCRGPFSRLVLPQLVP